MNRTCYACGATLLNEPALQGLEGLLCFPCRFRFDVNGGEAYLKNQREFAGTLADWNARFGNQWPKFKCWTSLTERLRITAFLFAVGAAALFVLGAHEVSTVAATVWILIGISAYFTNRKAQFLRCEPPPHEPRPDSRALSARPTVVLDHDCLSIGESQYDRYAGYPPDWRRRQEFCRRRDGHRCRICGSGDRLHVHHVWPVSFSANHTAQNIITLCRQCHMKQDYWDHRRLVAANIRANQRYSVREYVRADGVHVKGHRRRKGRRGKFWKGIKRQRVWKNAHS
jgi:hypothetical protein